MSVRKSSGCMYMYEAGEVISIAAVNQYHGVTGLQQDGCNDGVTFTASDDGAITNTADNATLLRCTSVAHGLTTGQYISIVGMGDAAHVGLTRVTVASDDLFDCDDVAFNSGGDSGDWVRGAQITVEAGHGGTYQLGFSASVRSASNNQDFRIEPAKNATMLDEMAVERRIAITSDLGSLATGGLANLQGGDVIWLLVKNVTSSANFEIEHANFNMHKL